MHHSHTASRGTRASVSRPNAGGNKRSGRARQPIRSCVILLGTRLRPGRITLAGMPPTERTPAAESLLVERLKAATETLELIAADRSTLALLSEDEQRRLRDAVAQVWNPDMRARRSLTKALARRRKRERSQRDERVLAATGIRELRRQPVFTTPKIFAPKAFQAEPPETADAAELLHLQERLFDRSPLLRPALRFLRRLELREADRTGRPARARRAPDRRPRQDRLPGGPQAAALRRPPHRHHAVPPRLGRHGTRRNRILASGAIDWRSSDSISVTRRAWRLSAGACCRPAIASTSSSTTPVRRSVVRPTSTRT